MRLDDDECQRVVDLVGDGDMGFPAPGLEPGQQLATQHDLGAVHTAARADELLAWGLSAAEAVVR